MLCTRPVLERCKVGPVEVIERPCGKCPSCLANKAQSWTYRLYAENKLHKKSCFITLTYNEESISRLYLSPTGVYSLKYEDLQNFMKLLRKNTGLKLRFYGVGEYGETTKRPHFHVILFGLDKEDRPEIERAWKYGFVTVGDVSPSSIAYVARYCTKKLFNDSLDYEKEGVMKEKAQMSLKPGIGANAIKKGVRYGQDGQMFVWFQGRRCGVPKYFKDKIRSALDVYKARLAAERTRDSRDRDYELSGRSESAEALQAEKNVLARRKKRRLV